MKMNKQTKNGGKYEVLKMTFKFITEEITKKIDFPPMGVNMEGNIKEDISKNIILLEIAQQLKEIKEILNTRLK